MQNIICTVTHIISILKNLFHVEMLKKIFSAVFRYIHVSLNNKIAYKIYFFNFLIINDLTLRKFETEISAPFKTIVYNIIYFISEKD